MLLLFITNRSRRLIKLSTILGFKNMKVKKPKNEKLHTIYAIYDETTDELISVSLDYGVLEMQLEMSGADADRFSMVEFDVKLI